MGNAIVCDTRVLDRTHTRQSGAAWGAAWCRGHVKAVPVGGLPGYQRLGMAQNTGSHMDGDVLGDGLLQSIDSPGAVPHSRFRRSGKPWECSLLVRLGRPRAWFALQPGAGQGNGLAGRIMYCVMHAVGQTTPFAGPYLWPAHVVDASISAAIAKIPRRKRAGRCGIPERRCAAELRRTSLSTTNSTPHSCSPSSPGFRIRLRSSKGLNPVFHKETFVSLPHSCVACSACLSHGNRCGSAFLQGACVLLAWATGVAQYGKVAHCRLS